MEALDDAVGLRALGLGSGVVDILDRQIELVFVAVVGPAVLGPTVGDVVLLVERDHPVVEQVCGGERGLSIGKLGVGVDEGLLVDPPHALERAPRRGRLSGPAHQPSRRPCAVLPRERDRWVRRLRRADRRLRQFRRRDVAQVRQRNRRQVSLLRAQPDGVFHAEALVPTARWCVFGNLDY